MVNYFVQFITVLLIYLIGNGLVRWLDLSVPGSIVGMALLFLGLTLKICKLKWVEAIAQLHIKHITLLFIPFAVGVWHYTGIFRIEGLKLTAILAASSIAVLLVTAGMAEFFEIKTKRGRQNGKNN